MSLSLQCDKYLKEYKQLSISIAIIKYEYPETNIILLSKVYKGVSNSKSIIGMIIISLLLLIHKKKSQIFYKNLVLFIY